MLNNCTAKHLIGIATMGLNYESYNALDAIISGGSFDVEDLLFPTIRVSDSVLKERHNHPPNNHGFSNKQKLNPKQYCGKHHNKKSRHLGY